MFAKSPCQYCGGNIEFDINYSGMMVQCPHCHVPTKLFVPEVSMVLKADDPQKSLESFSGSDVLPGPWMKEPVSEKQKAMMTLYGISFWPEITKGEASQLIDYAVSAGVKPTVESQVKAGEMFGKVRLQEMLKEITETLTVIGDESATITALKEAKKKVKGSVSSITEIIDKRIEGLRMRRLGEWIEKNR